MERHEAELLVQLLESMGVRALIEGRPDRLNWYGVVAHFEELPWAVPRGPR